MKGGVLVVVGGPAPADRVLRYVGNLLSGCDNFSVHLAYIASALPAGLLETADRRMPKYYSESNPGCARSKTRSRTQYSPLRERRWFGLACPDDRPRALPSG